MKRPELELAIYKILSEYEPSFVQGYSVKSVSRILKPDLEKLFAVLIGFDDFNQKVEAKRPDECSCPISKPYSYSIGSETLFEYKKKMLDYLANFGFFMLTPVNSPIVLIETVASFVEQNQK